MPSLLSTRMLLLGALLFFVFSSQTLAQRSSTRTSTRTLSSATSARPASISSSTPPSTGGSTTVQPISSGTSTSAPQVATTSTPPDVYLNVPELHVGRIELDVEELQADINLNAQVAGLVTVNAGVMVSVQKINITIADVDANLELIVRLGNLVDIVGRVFDSLDLNPLLLSLIGNVTNVVGEVIGAVDGLLGSITQGGTTLNFLVDNLGNIVQEVAGGATGAVSSIVGNYLQNMTQVGDATSVGNGLTQKTFSYAPLSALVNIIFNAAGQVVQATVQKSSGGGGTTTTSSTSGTATPVTLPVSSAITTAAVTST